MHRTHASAQAVKNSLTVLRHDFERDRQPSLKGSVMPNLEQAIRERAYHLWIADGQPEGKAEVYWLSAQGEVLTASLDASDIPATAQMDSVSATTKPATKAKLARSGKSKAR